jgi:ATP:ADP antiporter, AAA family
MLDYFKKKLISFDSTQKVFILSVLFCNFFISLDYSIIRPASSSIFISCFTSKLFPYSWILGVPFNLFIVYLYNRFLPVIGCLKTFFIFSFSVIVVNVFTSLFIHQFPFLIFFQFIFKDVYILLAFKQLWSMIHTTIDTQKAKFLYGFMFGLGGVGSVLGGIISGFFAVKLKSANLMLFSLPIYIIVFFLYRIALKNSGIKGDFKKEIMEENALPKKAFSLIKKSPYMTIILLIVISMQISTAFLDYQFNVFLEKAIPSLDLRTQFTGKLTSIINTISTCFQFFGGYLLINFLGFKKSHLSIPILLACNSLLFLIFPSFAMISYAFSTIKSLDYSLFSILREMLYIPLKTDEKYRAKAIIDVFAYRSAKAFASLFLIFIQNITGLNIILLVTIMSMIIYLVWTRVVIVLFKKEKELTQS